MELFWRDTLTCPTEADFLEMVNDSKYIKNVFGALLFTYYRNGRSSKTGCQVNAGS